MYEAVSVTYYNKINRCKYSLFEEMNFSESEKRDIYEIFIKNGYNKSRAKREYQRIYQGQRRIPSLNTFPRVYNKVSAEHSFKRKKRTLVRNENYENEELEILLQFQGIFFLYFISAF